MHKLDKIFIVIIAVSLAVLFTNYFFLSYIQTEPSSVAGKNILIMDSYCIAGNEGVFLIRNTGTMDIKVGPGGDVAVIEIVSGQDPDGTWYDMNDSEGKLPLTQVEPGQVARYKVSCTDLCMFRFVVGGRTMQDSVQC